MSSVQFLIWLSGLFLFVLLMLSPCLCYFIFAFLPLFSETLSELFWELERMHLLGWSLLFDAVSLSSKLDGEFTICRNALFSAGVTSSAMEGLLPSCRLTPRFAYFIWSRKPSQTGFFSYSVLWSCVVSSPPATQL